MLVLPLTETFVTLYYHVFENSKIVIPVRTKFFIQTSGRSLLIIQTFESQIIAKNIWILHFTSFLSE